MKLRERYLDNVWSLALLLCVLFISLGLFLSDVKLVIDLKLLLFILSGICSGIFYGVNNHVVFHHPYDKNYYEKKKSDFKDVGVFPGIPVLNPIAQIHIFWVHIISGIIGSVFLYLLSFRISSLESFVNGDVWWLNLFLLLISVLGYVGYMPRTLWFFATKGGIGIDKPT